MSERIARAAGSLLERRLSRRGALARMTLAGTAFAVAPLRYLMRPESAHAVVHPGRCRGGRCTDGWTAFCCEIDAQHRNACPDGSYVAGWWKCTDYRGRGLCGDEGVRYYIDCNRSPGDYAGGCRCAQGDCKRRRVGCNHFRYGQCNTDVQGTTEVVCRVIVCRHPADVAEFRCNRTLKVDDRTCHHEADCLRGLVAQEPGQGGA